MPPTRALSVTPSEWTTSPSEVTSSSEEKLDKSLSGPDSGSDTEAAGFDKKATARLIRKIDFTLIPFLALLYLLSFLDRTNIGNARLQGLEADLGMDPNSLQYNNALAIFFPFYVAAEVPSNMMMKRWKPSRWIPTIMVAWGLSCTFMGLCTSYPGLMAARAALGLAEGGLFPGITYYMTMWYKRYECGFRISIFFSAATAAGAFGGLLARGIGEMSGLGGLGGWAWIFILEGILTVILAIIAFFVMKDYPATVKFLTEDERREVLRRLKSDRAGEDNQFDIKYFWDALKDWKIWMQMTINIGVYIPLYSFSLFLPTIVRDLGYTDDRAQLMTVPPYIVACFFVIGGGYFADRFQTRGIFLIGYNLLAMVGFTMLLVSENVTIKYAATFLAAAGVYPNIPMGVAWIGNNIGGSLKRGVGIAMQVGAGNLGGVVAAYIYRSKDRPRFTTGHAVLIGSLTMSSVLATVMTVYLRRENARRDRVSPKLPHQYTDAEKELEKSLGDNASFYRYTT